jgi:hypothetical protein
MSDTLPVPAKRPSTVKSDLAQVLDHGPAYSQAYGKVLGALLMIIAINKASRGAFGFAVAAIAVVSAYKHFWK